MAASAGRCPAVEDLERLLGEELGDADRIAVEAHVESCSSCQERLERLVAPAAAAPATATREVPGGRLAEPDEAFLDRLRHLQLTPAADSVREPDQRFPSHLGPYEILAKLGHGGMGTVYRARHRDLDKVVALKVLPADRVDEAAVARFRNEMKAAGRLGHPNIVAAHDAGRVGGTYFLAMDFVDGEDLSALVERLGPLPVADACELVRQAAVGLQHACECGLAHRDVKPSNLMLARDGVVKVLDLGLARSLADVPTVDRLTATGVLLGTADYIAPEQIDRASAADARSDVYGLGGTLYFLLVGSPPFGGDRYGTWLQKLRAHAEAPIPPVRRHRPEVPATLAALLERMLAKVPADRPATPGDVADALRPFAAGADLPNLLARTNIRIPRPAPGATRTAVRPRRFPGPVLRYGLAAVAGAVVALLAALPFFGRSQPPGPPGDGTPQPLQSVEEGVRLTYGPYGPPRPDTRVLPGEVVEVEFVVNGVGRNPKGEVDITIAGELIDMDGKRWAEFIPTPFKGPRYLGGSTLINRASFELLPRQPPGEYRARARLTDRITGWVANVEHPVYVLRPEFGAIRLRLTHDRDGVWPAGGNLTVGQEFFLHAQVVNTARDGERVRIAGKVSVRDRGGNESTPAPIPPLKLDREVQAGSAIEFATPLRAIMAGEATIVVELEDLIGKKSAAYELPVVIHPPRSGR